MGRRKGGRTDTVTVQKSKPSSPSWLQATEDEEAESSVKDVCKLVEAKSVEVKPVQVQPAQSNLDDSDSMNDNLVRPKAESETSKAKSKPNYKTQSRPDELAESKALKTKSGLDYKRHSKPDDVTEAAPLELPPIKRKGLKKIAKEVILPDGSKVVKIKTKTRSRQKNLRKDTRIRV